MIDHRLALAIACAACGCGDNAHPSDEPAGDLFTPVSGSRLALQKYRYADGTELAVATEFYDTLLHARCTAEPWPDGAVRCVPVADDLEYTDPACTAAIGLGRTIARPAYFVARDTRPSGGVVTRVVRAGAPAPSITQYYGMIDGACAGPVAAPTGLANLFQVGDTVDAGQLVAFHDGELGDGRLGLRTRETDDGLRVAPGLRDRELDVACVPTIQDDGRVMCEPTGAAAASWFRDPGCSEPVAAVAAPAVPSIARFIEPSGCASYHPLGAEVSPPIYRRDGDACSAADPPAGSRLFAVGAPLELPALDRSLEDVAGRRLHRVILGHGALRFADDRLFDTATGVDCKPRALRDTFRCIPARIAAATTLFTQGCVAQVRVAELARHTCEPVVFATANRPFQILAIGAVAPGAMYRLDGDACHTYAGAPGNELRTLGPPVDLATFPTAIYFGER